MTRRRWSAPLGAVIAAAIAASVGAQVATPPAGVPADSGHVSGGDPAGTTTPLANPDVPFSVGERATYDVKFGFVHVGTGSMTVANVQTLRGHDVWHTVFDIKGGTLFYHVNDTLESWFDVNTLSSFRFLQRLDEGGRIRNRNYEIFPDSSIYVLNRKPPQPSVSNPLDDGSFLFFVRTLPLNLGETYTFPRYFNPKANPVTIKVVRKERIQVPAGTFQAVVVQPIIKTSGIFSDKGRAEVWFSDDSQHIVLQMKSKMSIGSLDMYLRSFQPGRGAAASVPTGAAPDSAVLPPEAPPSPPAPPDAGKPAQVDTPSKP
jgi:Protein of unknown function (DUF3108)